MPNPFDNPKKARAEEKQEPVERQPETVPEPELKPNIITTTTQQEKGDKKDE